MKRIIALCIGFAVLAACATNSPPSTNYNETVQRLLTYSGDPINRFTSMQGIRNWEVVSDDHLVLYTDANTAYLIKVWNCPGLLRARSLEVVSAIAPDADKLGRRQTSPDTDKLGHRRPSPDDEGLEFDEASRHPNSVRRSDEILVEGESCPIREIRQVDVFRMRADKNATKEKKKT